MRALFEFVLLGGSVLAVVAWVTYILRKVRARGYQAHFVGGALDGQIKTLQTLPKTFNATVGHDYKRNDLVAVYELDDSELGIYTHIGDEVVKLKR